MAWFNYFKYDMGDSNEATYLLCYFLFTCNATAEEQRELAQIRDEYHGDNHQALDIMCRRLYHRQIKARDEKEKQEIYRRNKLQEIQDSPEKKEWEANKERWKHLSLDEIDKKMIFKDDDELTEEEFYEMFKQPVLRTIVLNEDLSYDILDKFCGCYTYVFKTRFRPDPPKYKGLKTSYTARYYRMFHNDPDEFKTLHWIAMQQLNDEIAYRKEEEKAFLAKQKEKEDKKNAQLAKLDKSLLAYEAEFEERYLDGRDTTDETRFRHRWFGMTKPDRVKDNHFYFENRHEWLTQFYAERRKKHKYIPVSSVEYYFKKWIEKNIPWFK